MMFVRTVNGFMYYPPGPGLTTPTSAGSASLSTGLSANLSANLSVSSAISSPTRATALQTIPNVSPTTVTPSPLNGCAHTPAALSSGFAGYTPSATPTATGGLNGFNTGLSTINGALTGYTPVAAAHTAGSLSGLNGITGTAGINGLTTTGLNGGLAAMSSTTALLGTIGTKWMLPDWSALGLRFPLVRYVVLSPIFAWFCVFFFPFFVTQV